MNTYFEVWMKSAPLTVQERAEDGVTLSWLDREPAVARARQLHSLYSGLHFVVRESRGGDHRIVFDTSQPA